MSLHSGHSKVWIWKPQRPGVTRASIVVVLQIGHSGRTSKDMMLALSQAGAQHSQSPDGCHYRAGDGDSLERNEPPPLFNFAQFIKSSQKINEWSSPKRSYPLSSDQVCSPQSHLNMRVVRPFWGLSIFRMSLGFSAQ